MSDTNTHTDIIKARRTRAAARRVTTAVAATPAVNFTDVARRHRKNKRRQNERPPVPAVPPIKVTAGQPGHPAAIRRGLAPAAIVPGTAREWTAQLNSQPPSRSNEDMSNDRIKDAQFDRDARAARDAQEKRAIDARAEARAESRVGATAPAANRADSERKADADAEGKPVTVDTSAALDHASNKARAARQDGSRSSTAAESDAVDAERARVKAADKPYYVRLEQGEESVVLNPSFQGGVKVDRPGQGTTVESPNTVTLNGGVQIVTGGSPGDRDRDLVSEQPARKFSSGKPFKRAERRVEVSINEPDESYVDAELVEDDFDGVDDGR